MSRPLSRPPLPRYVFRLFFLVVGMIGLFTAWVLSEVPVGVRLRWYAAGVAAGIGCGGVVMLWVRFGGGLPSGRAQMRRVKDQAWLYGGLGAGVSAVVSRFGPRFATFFFALVSAFTLTFAVMPEPRDGGRRPSRGPRGQRARSASPRRRSSYEGPSAATDAGTGLGQGLHADEQGQRAQDP